MYTGNDTYPQRNSGPSLIWQEHFTQASALEISLMYETPDKPWVREFFFYLTAKPKAGNAYLVNKKICFKISIPQAVAIQLAIRGYATGAGQNIGPNYLIWADPSKANQDAAARRGKILEIKGDQDKAERSVVFIFNRGTEAGAEKDSHPQVRVAFKAWDALALATIFNQMLEHAQKLTRERSMQPLPLPASRPSYDRQQGNGQGNRTPNQSIPGQAPDRRAAV